MYFATITIDDIACPIAVSADKSRYCSLKDLGYNTLLECICSFSANDFEYISKALHNGQDFLEAEHTFLAPIPYPPRNAFCLGKNYQDHLEEIPMFAGAKGGVITYPIYFTKLAYPSKGNFDTVSRYTQYKGELDYETELAVIIAKQGRDISPSQASKYIFGYTICNDWTLRNFQKAHSQWFKGKSFDGHLTMGPYIAHSSIISYPPKLDLQTIVNGEVRQHSNTANLIFDIGYVISDLSKGLTLYPGDIILTGTCKGVGIGYTPPRYLKAGDKVTSTIEKIGQLTSFIVD